MFLTVSAKNRNGRRRALKTIVDATILTVTGAVVNTLRIFTGGFEAASTTANQAAVPTSTTSAVAVSTTPSGPGASTAVVLAWPMLKAMNAKSLKPLQPLVFDYPTVGTPDILVKLSPQMRATVVTLV